MLLNEMDRVKKVTRYVFVLAATNHPNLVDEVTLTREDLISQLSAT